MILFSPNNLHICQMLILGVFSMLNVVTTENTLQYVSSDADVVCHAFDDACSSCIQQLDCMWCAELAKNWSVHHCFSHSSNISGFCKMIEDEKNSLPILIEDRPLTGKAVNMTLSFRRVKDYPLDLYFLMDLSKSMLKDKKTLASLGRQLARTMRRLTSQFKIGFGSFVDKIMLPFVNIHEKVLRRPCEDYDCARPFSFENNLKLTERDELFVSEVEKAKISSNLDSPEGGFDALMQAMVCDEVIGWRKNVRKIIVFSTDASSHMAGDGKLAGIIQPNNGKCHMNNNVYENFKEYDYPSIGQINYVAQQKGIHIIFAAKRRFARFYNDIARVIKGASFGELSGNSSNVIDLVTDVYNNITDNVDIAVTSAPRNSPLTFRFFTNCENSSDLSRAPERDTCNKIKEGSNFNFKVEITATNCPEREEERKQTVKIGTVQDSLTIDAELICSCQCESVYHKGYEPNSTHCSHNGKRQCDVCQCNEGFYGNKCQCSSNKRNRNIQSDENKCRATGSELICSGRGKCECETCRCWKKRHYGRFCQCDQNLCKNIVNSDVECSGNGRCDCNVCVCNAGWDGKFCACRSRQFCQKSRNDNICSSNGVCICGKCECKVPYTGKYCEECPSCGEGKCLEFRPCVQCKIWGSGPHSDWQCKKCRQNSIPTLNNLQGQLNQYARLCTFEDLNTGCEFNFTYKYTDNGYEIYAQSHQVCPIKVDTLAVTFGVIAGVVLVGLFTLILWKILTTIHDRLEVENFEKETKNAIWSSQGNPLYKSPTTEISNPAFRLK